jgi:hypothetical protein
VDWPGRRVTQFVRLTKHSKLVPNESEWCSRPSTFAHHPHVAHQHKICLLAITALLDLVRSFTKPRDRTMRARLVIVAVLSLPALCLAAPKIESTEEQAIKAILFHPWSSYPALAEDDPMLKALRDRLDVALKLEADGETWFYLDRRLQLHEPKFLSTLLEDYRRKKRMPCLSMDEYLAIVLADINQNVIPVVKVEIPLKSDGKHNTRLEMAKLILKTLDEAQQNEGKRKQER